MSSHDDDKLGLGSVGLFGMNRPVYGLPSAGLGTARGALAAALREGTELHTKPHVAHIAGIGASHPENLTNDQVQSLCGEVLRHIRRMEGKG